MIARSADYDTAAAVPERAEILAGWRRASEAAAAALAHRTLPYGAGAAETFDLFPAGAGAPLLVWIHGGWWRALSKDDNAFVARGLVARGVTVANVDYPLAPEAPLAAIVASCRAALAAAVRAAPAHGIDASRVVVAGHSAGGHLAAMCALEAEVRGVASISGLHDLRPLVATFANDALRLDAAEAAALSPALHRPRVPAPTLAAVGGRELPGFRAQAALLADARRAQGLPAELVTTPGDHHFAIVDRLADPDDPLTRALAALAGAA